jgi:hypothetical protein
VVWVFGVLFVSASDAARHGGCRLPALIVPHPCSGICTGASAVWEAGSLRSACCHCLNSDDAFDSLASSCDHVAGSDVLIVALVGSEGFTGLLFLCCWFVLRVFFFDLSPAWRDWIGAAVRFSVSELLQQWQLLQFLATVKPVWS